MRPIVIAIGKKHRPYPGDVGSVPFLVFGLNQFIVGCHHSFSLRSRCLAARQFSLLNLPSLHNLALLRNPVHDNALARIDERYMMSDQADEILTVEEVATFLKAGKRTVYRLAANGTIPAFKLGGTWRFRREDLNAWIESRTGYPAPEKAKGANNQ